MAGVRPVFMLMAADSSPPVFGVNVTETVHEVPLVSVWLVSAQEHGYTLNTPGEELLIVLITKLEPPMFLIVTIRASDDEPTRTFPK